VCEVVLTKEKVIMFQVRAKKRVPKVSLDDTLRPPRGVAPGTQPSGKSVVKYRNKPTDKHDKGPA
jgi:hypothetical protein